jgi:hypothetical protein
MRNNERMVGWPRRAFREPVKDFEVCSELVLWMLVLVLVLMLMLMIVVYEGLKIDGGSSVLLLMGD